MGHVTNVQKYNYHFKESFSYDQQRQAVRILLRIRGTDVSTLQHLHSVDTSIFIFSFVSFDVS